MRIFYCKNCEDYVFYTDVIEDKETGEMCCPKCLKRVEETSDY